MKHFYMLSSKKYKANWFCSNENEKEALKDFIKMACLDDGLNEDKLDFTSIQDVKDLAIQSNDKYHLSILKDLEKVNGINQRPLTGQELKIKQLEAKNSKEKHTIDITYHLILTASIVANLYMLLRLL